MSPSMKAASVDCWTADFSDGQRLAILVAKGYFIMIGNPHDTDEESRSVLHLTREQAQALARGLKALGVSDKRS